MAVKPPLVIPQSRRLPVRIGTKSFRKTGFSRQEDISVEMERQYLSDYRYVLQAIAAVEVDEQARINNEPTVSIVDNVEGKAWSRVRRRIELQFGDLLDKALVRAVIYSLRRTMRQKLAVLEKRGIWLDDEQRAEWMRASNVGSGWKWVYSPGGDQPRIDNFNPLARDVQMSRGASLILSPRAGTIYFFNSMAHNFGSRIIVGRGKNRGKRHTVLMGFMQESISKFKRARLFRNYRIYTDFSSKHRNPQDTGQWGTPFIRIKFARAKRASYRRGGRRVEL